MCMPEKEVNKISPRVENIIKGLFLVLLSIVIGINVGKIGRTLAFVPLYLFGASYYFVVIYLFFIGAYRIVRKKRFKFKRLSIWSGLLLMFLGSLFLIPFIFYKANGLSFSGIKFNEFISQYNGELGQYYGLYFINVFDGNYLWSFGIISVLVCGFVANDLIIAFLGSILTVLGLAILVVPMIFKSLRKEKATKTEKKKAIKKYREENQYNDENDYDEQEDVPVITRDDIKAIRIDKYENQQLEPAEIKAGYEPERAPIVNDNSGFNQVNSSLDEMFGQINVSKKTTNEYNEFTPLVFNSDANPFAYAQQTRVEVTPQPAPAPVEEKVEVVEEVEETNLIDSRPSEVRIEEFKQEQPAVSEPQIDESLVRMQPQFSEVHEVKNEVTNSIPEPVVQEVKKKKERVVWIPPSPELLSTYEIGEALELNEQVANQRVAALNNILSDFKIGATISGFTIGPSITRFNIEYEPNVSSKSVEKYVQDISRRLGGVSSRFAAVVPGESYSGLEVPNATITTVGFKETFTCLPDVKKHPLAVAFGKDISGNVIYADFDEFPHLLVAGTTGSGKSIYVHSIISTLIMRNSPDDLKLVLVDPKKVEMTKYRDMPHLLCPIITEAEKVNVCLRKLCDEMNRRYEIFSENGEVSNIKDYNKFAKEAGIDPLPYIIIFIDEYADLVDQCKEISQPVVSLAQKARAAGIHMCIATQRPSTNIITGVIKGNIPTHVALMTSSYTDSIIIIGEGGAETLLGKGDMLVQSPLVSRVGVTRLQGCYVQNKEIVHIVNYLKEHYETQYDENYLDLVDHSKEPAVPVNPGEVEKESSAEEENKYQSIKEWVMSQQFVSMSKIQRECGVGFNRAGRFFSRLQKEGVVSTTQDGSSKGCRVLVHDDDMYGDNYVSSDELIG